tara:strand:- start:642 stop:1124 length:483 start_codon:yes stop_codon:yes gene_type:complete
MKVIDNFLPKEDFLKLQNALMSQEMPWYFQPSINKNHRKSDLDCYFTHGLYYQNFGYSNYFDYVRPIVKSINPKALIRIKANLYIKTEKMEIHKPHVDYEFKHKGAIFYVNTNNGKTILHDGTKIDSIGNRLLLFDSNKEHSSSSTTDSKCRVNINFNYF